MGSSGASGGSSSCWVVGTWSRCCGLSTGSRWAEKFTDTGLEYVVDTGWVTFASGKAGGKRVDCWSGDWGWVTGWDLVQCGTVCADSLRTSTGNRLWAEKVAYTRLKNVINTCWVVFTGSKAGSKRVDDWGSDRCWASRWLGVQGRGMCAVSSRSGRSGASICSWVASSCCSAWSTGLALLSPLSSFCASLSTFLCASL